MRKFSNKSKKEKKNAIRRKTKGNRRNNKRRTYRKKMKGGDASDNIKENVKSLMTIIDLVFKEYKDIDDLKYYKERFNKKVSDLASDKSHCNWTWNSTKCRENKKYLFTSTVILLNYYDEGLLKLIDHLENKSTISSRDETKSLVKSLVKSLEEDFRKIIENNLAANQGAG